jgi:hypothetical protein
MRYSPTKYDFRIKLKKKQQDIFNNILDYFDVPNTGLLFIVDSENYNSSIYPSWGIDAQALDLSQSDVDSMCPHYIWSVTRRDNYQFLLWFSKRVSLYPNINFTWIVAHELTHYKQSIFTPELLIINSFLLEILPSLSIKGVKSLISIPIELDAELNAWEITKNLFSNTQIKAFFENKIRDPKYSGHYKELMRYNPNNYYDVIRSTIDFLEYYYDMILAIQRKSNDNYISKFDIKSKINILNNAHNIYLSFKVKRK